MITDWLFQGDHTIKGIAVIALIISILVFAYAVEKIAEGGRRGKKQ
ncbi:MAG TPA: hypothetical protein PL048_19640 [Leptospiraceae bacterium]|nr:hypothetical protein [Leptospiraceae bacterium]HMY66955.1 hypothetical protein [Leptospiraceae bacterium]HMZ60999.1 hypothetical protein [Leptospiraceae bacterium]HNF14889.1 hypothetical protein [Leptospiraceae bacterium]HNF26119.1 hypothetical protein [Leptospiraceae bacterium]